jgi:hypothetical protein
MSTALRQSIHQEVHREADLVQEFTRTYRAKLAEMIDRLNASLDAPPAGRSDLQSIRWCVEAVDMMLASQAQFAKAMDRLASNA